MSQEFTGLTPDLQAWILLHRTRDLLFRCEDRAVGEFGLTAEQHAVFVAMKLLDDPVRPTDVGRVLNHKVNTVSMIVDRMVSGGLLERVRDLPDRRAVRLVITTKGEKAFKPAHSAVSKLVDEILSALSREDMDTLTKLLGAIRDKAHRHLNSGN